MLLRRSLHICLCWCRFPKIKEEGWFLLLGNVASGELLALKRLGVPVGRTAKSTLSCPTTLETGEALASVRVYLLSDSYLGLDQLADIDVAAVAGGESAKSAMVHGGYWRDGWAALDSGGTGGK